MPSGEPGLFARRYIKRGTTIWLYDPSVDFFYSMDDYCRLPPEKRQEIAIHVYPTYLDGTPGVMISLDNDRYMNHSERSNAGRRKPENGADSGNFRRA